MYKLCFINIEIHRVIRNNFESHIRILYNIMPDNSIIEQNRK